MNKVIELHHEAMRSYDEVTIHRLKNGKGMLPSDVSLALRNAYRREREAALLLLNETEQEPTRSVLFRSAAWLALQCGEARDAELLATQGLQGSPPTELAQELREVRKQAGFA